jgi:hypothetical protein
MMDASAVRRGAVKIGEKRSDRAQRRKYARQQEAGKGPEWDGAIRPVTLVRADASPTGELKR